jgi:hypothetical protein
MAGILFPTLRIYREFYDIDHRLHEIALELIERFWPDASHPARITCIFRTQAEEIAAGGKSGIHSLSSPYRAIDIGAKEFSQVQIDASAAALNARWLYDPARPAKLVCFSEPHGSGPHFHLQVHPSTRRR